MNHLDPVFKLMDDMLAPHVDTLKDAQARLERAYLHQERAEAVVDRAQGRCIDAEQTVKLAEAEVALLKRRRAGDEVKP